MKRILALLLALVMVCSLAPVAFAADETTTATTTTTTTTTPTVPAPGTLAARFSALMERIRLLLTRDDLKQVELLCQQATVRIQQLEQNSGVNATLLSRLTEEYMARIQTASERLVRAQQRGRNVTAATERLQRAIAAADKLQTRLQERDQERLQERLNETVDKAATVAACVRDVDPAVVTELRTLDYGYGQIALASVLAKAAGQNADGTPVLTVKAAAELISEMGFGQAAKSLGLKVSDLRRAAKGSAVPADVDDDDAPEATEATPNTVHGTTTGSGTTTGTGTTGAGTGTGNGHKGGK